MKKKTDKKSNDKQKQDYKKIIRNALFIVTVIATLYIIFTIYNLQMLPMKYLVVVVVLLLGLMAGLLLWLKKSNSKLSQIIAGVLSIALILGAFQIARVSSLIGKVTGAETETHTVNVVVMKDSTIEKMSDLEGVPLGANTAFDEKNITRTQERIEKEEKYEVTINPYKTYQGLIDDLYSGELEAIILSEAHASLLEESKENFAEETRIIQSYEFQDAVENTNKKDTNVNTDTYSIFVTGIDTYGPISSVSRSDVNMIVTVNPNTNQILLTSIPRDYHVTLHSFGAKDKLTHAGIYGVNESMRTLEDLLSSQVDEKIDIDYYLRVNFSSVQNIVDALGGVEVYSRYDFTTNAGGYSYQKGMNHVNGPEALGFVRERYSLPNGDFDRIINQQALITGVINKAMSPAIITNFGSFLNSVGDGFEFSMSDKDLNSIIKNQISTMESWEILSVQMKGYGATSGNTYSMPGWNLYVNEPDYSSVEYAARLIQQMENNERISVD